MGKRKIKITPVAVLVALLALFLGTGVALAVPLPNTKCTLLNSAGQPTAYSVQFNGAFPYGISPYDNTSWSYTHNSGGTQIAILVPVCDPVQFPPPGNQIYDGNNYVPTPTQPGTVIYKTNPFSPASLQPTWNGFGVWDAMDQLITITSSGSQTFSIGTDNAVPIPYRVTSMQFKAGNNYLYCPNIAGPGCAVAPPPPPPLSTVNYTCEQINEVTWLRTDYKECSNFEVQFCTAGCTDCTPIEPTTVSLSDPDDPDNPNNTAVLHCGSTNQGCNLCEVKGKKNPCSTWKIGDDGRAFKYCYRCDTLQHCSCSSPYGILVP